MDDDAGMTTETSETTDRHGRCTLGIVDNDPLVAEALRSSFERFHAPLEMIWTLTDPEDALAHCLHAQGRPDVLLTDIDMPASPASASSTNSKTANSPSPSSASPRSRTSPKNPVWSSCPRNPPSRRSSNSPACSAVTTT
ncbi:response regulator [Bifidobacterium animalis subsp. animalis]|nr:response regulator [Bifidobacterium animalis subsp. animalis]